METRQSKLALHGARAPDRGRGLSPDFPPKQMISVLKLSIITHLQAH